jgi:RNA polymerase sigma-70 factor, ECF subfamily
MKEYRTQTDEALLLLIQRGDASAFSELVIRHTDYFYRVAWRNWPDREEAEDIVQEAFVKVWQDPFIYDADKGAKFTTWFYRVVTNMALDRARKKKPVHIDPVHLGQFIEGSEKNPAAEYVDREEVAALENAIQELPERQKLALNLCFYDGLSNQEAADIMEVGVKALESLLMRAKNGIRNSLVTKGILSEEEVA